MDPAEVREVAYRRTARRRQAAALILVPVRMGRRHDRPEPRSAPSAAGRLVQLGTAVAWGWPSSLLAVAVRAPWLAAHRRAGRAPLLIGRLADKYQ